MYGERRLFKCANKFGELLLIDRRGELCTLGWSPNSGPGKSARFCAQPLRLQIQLTANLVLGIRLIEQALEHRLGLGDVQVPALVRIKPFSPVHQLRPVLLQRLCSLSASFCRCLSH